MRATFAAPVIVVMQEMKMASGHEFDLIARIRKAAPAGQTVVVGIGDDASVLHASDDANVLVAKDVLMEGVHFDLSTASPQSVGRKALAVNLSDIAAMAGRPLSAFVGLVLPASRGARFADQLMSGLIDLAEQHGVALAGGDTNIWDGPTVVSVTLIGQPTGGRAVLRSGGQPGDWLMVTGALGGSLAGRHLQFSPRLYEAEQLHQAADLHAMIDLSDGLASDVRHLLTDACLGAIIDASAVPIHADVPSTLSPSERLAHAISDGEDFELLFAVDPSTGRHLLDQPPFATSLTKVGELTAETGCRLRNADGRSRALEATGWQHQFAR